MRRLRTRHSFVFVCLAIVLVAALVPTLASSLSATLTPRWLLFPAAAVMVVRRMAMRCGDQPLSLLSLVLSRAPPAQM